MHWTRMSMGPVGNTEQGSYGTSEGGKAVSAPNITYMFSGDPKAGQTCGGVAKMQQKLPKL